MKLIVLFIIQLYLSSQVFAQKSLSIEAGNSNTELNSKYSVSNTDVSLTPLKYVGVLSEHTYSNNVGFGVGLNLIFEGILGDSDRYRVTNMLGQISKYFKSDNNIYFAPNMGITRWELSAVEKQLFNPGPEQRIKEQGTDVFYGFNLGIKKEKTASYFILFKRYEYSFGASEVVAFGINKKI